MPPAVTALPHRQWLFLTGIGAKVLERTFRFAQKCTEMEQRAYRRGEKYVGVEGKLRQMEEMVRD